MADEKDNQAATPAPQPVGQVVETVPAAIPVRIDTSEDVYLFKGDKSIPLTPKEGQ